MTRGLIIAALAVSLASPVLAAGSGNVKKGKKDFRQCRSCHSIQDKDGNMIVKGGKIGPNLYGVIGSKAADVEGYNFDKAMIAAGEAGLVWNEENFTGYVTDPSGFISDFLGEKSRVKMTFKLRKGAEDIYAYLATFSPDNAADGDAPASN